MQGRFRNPARLGLGRMVAVAGLASGLIAGVVPAARAQGSGLSQFLPPVPPLTMPSAPQRAGKGGKAATATAAPATAPAGNATVNKAILNGPVSMKLTVEGAVQRIMLVTNRPFAPIDQFTALDAARAVQRDLAISCGKLCKPAKMISPVIDANGHLTFDMAIQGFARQLTTADIMALLQATPLSKGETPAVTPAAAAPAAPSSSGVARPTPPAAPAVPVPPKPPAAASASQPQ